MVTLTELEARHIVETVQEVLRQEEACEPWMQDELIDDLKEILRLLGAEEEHDEP